MYFVSNVPCCGICLVLVNLSMKLLYSYMFPEVLVLSGSTSITLLIRKF